MAANHREIFLIVYNSPLFPAHWAIFIPTTANHDLGKVIHATGDVLNGFALEFKRGYDLSATSRKKTLIPLCTVDSKYVIDGPADRSTDQKPIDHIESIAATIPAPGKTLKAAKSADAAKVQLQNCQTWLKKVVEALIAAGIFPAEALTVIDGAPKN
ncbi:hypothetical protein P7C71_g5640, partial [Lecanoromycetidae sp. Uapishka_2]